MKIAVLGSRGVPNRYGGFEEMAAQVVPLWVKAGHDVAVYSISNHPEKVHNFHGARVIHIYNPEPTLGLAGQFVYDLFSLIHARVKERPDIYLQLGYTTSALWSFLWDSKRSLTNMDGIEYKRAKYAGVLSSFLRWSERRAAARSKLLVADNPGIAEHLVQSYKNPITTIAYGAQVTHKHHYHLAELTSLHLESGKYHLHIGRVQPDNHVREILQAASESGEQLVAVGDYSTPYGRKLHSEFQSFSNIKFLGTLYKKSTIDALRLHCTSYIHGHSAGGTNPALLEAMGCGCFVLAHNNPFNNSVLGGLGGRWKDANDLKELMTRLPNASLKSVQKELAQERIREFFQWEKVADAYLEAFQRVLEK